MIARFFLLWIVITAIVFGWAYIAKNEDKKLAKFWLKRVAISAAITLAMIGALLTLNNISGV